jgi:DNA-binding NtrC family response regulator
MTDRRHSILVVDDSPNWREFLGLLLEDDYVVHSAATYEEAVGLLQQQEPQFDVAIIDIRLVDSDRDNEDGLKLLEYIQSSGLVTRVIMLTGYPDLRSSKRAFRDLGAYEYLEKYPLGGEGLNIDLLRQVVRDAIGIPRALLVEDDPHWQDLLADILEEDGYTVDRAASSADAHQHLESASYPVAVVDLKLGSDSPEKGIEFLVQLSGTAKDLGLVVISGYGTKAIVRDVFERSRAKAFIFKDEFDPMQFRKKVRRAAVMRWS